LLHLYCSPLLLKNLPFLTTTPLPPINPYPSYLITVNFQWLYRAHHNTCGAQHAGAFTKHINYNIIHIKSYIIVSQWYTEIQTWSIHIFWKYTYIYTSVVKCTSTTVCVYNHLKFYKKHPPFPYKFCNKEHSIFTDYTQ
jgi:hypothetical protein